MILRNKILNLINKSTYANHALMIVNVDDQYLERREKKNLKKKTDLFKTKQNNSKTDSVY